MCRAHSLAYIYSGELVIEEGSRTFSVKKGECVFIRRDNRVTMTKRAYGREQFRSVFMNFNRSFLREYFQSLDHKKLPTNAKRFHTSVVKLSNTPAVESLFISLIPYFNMMFTSTEKVIELKRLEGILILLQMDERFYPILFDFTEPWKIDILDYLNENYMYELSIEEIAFFTGRSLATFKRDFKKISELTPQKWLIQKRLQVAHDMLKGNNSKASDVYVEVGFKNLSHFYTAFKKQYSFSPRKR